MILSTNEEKALDKIKHLFMKSLRRTGKEGEPHLDKDHLQKSADNITLNGKGLNAFSLYREQSKTTCSHHSYAT